MSEKEREEGGGRERGGRRREGNDVVCEQSNDLLFEANTFHICVCIPDL